MRTSPLLLSVLSLAALAACDSSAGTGSGGTTTAGGGGTSTSGGNSNGSGGAEMRPTGTALTAGSPELTLSGTAGGPYPSSVIGADCYGFTAALPSHVLDVGEGIGSLRFAGDATTDTVLFVRTPTGEMHCDDDGGGYPNPLVTIGTVTPGRYQIWYGTYGGGEGGPYTLTVTALAPPTTLTATTFAGVPSYCGMTTPVYGPITIGTSVVLGTHTGWTGSDGHGGTVTNDTWWNSMMSAYVGRRATVTEMPGLDPVGCPYVRVDIDSGTWGWRIRDLSP